MHVVCLTWVQPHRSYRTATKERQPALAHHDATQFEMSSTGLDRILKQC